MGQNTLVREEIDAGAEFVRRFNEVFPLCAAFWMRAEEWSPQYLYISSEQFTDNNRNEVFRAIAQIAQETNDPNFDLFRVRVLGSDHPMVRDVEKIHLRHPGQKGIHFTGNYLGDTPLDDAYIYPQLTGKA